MHKDPGGDCHWKGEHPTCHVTSFVLVDTFWSGKGLPRQEHESLMQDGLRIDGKLWPCRSLCPSFHTRKSKCLLFGDYGNWLIIWIIGFVYTVFFFIYCIYTCQIRFVGRLLQEFLKWLLQVARISQVSQPHQEFVHAHLMTILQWLGVAKSGSVFHVCLGLPPRKRSHIPTGEKENRPLKSADWQGTCDRSHGGNLCKIVTFVILCLV